MENRIGRKFYERHTPEVARELIGCRLVRVIGGRRLSGIVVESEAYRGPMDPASHAYRGRTPRNSVMFGPPGYAYVYFTMGLHHCLNVTTENTGTPGAVLFRAIEPDEGVGVMMRNRRTWHVDRIASGPGNLTMALDIDAELNGEDLVRSGRLFLERGRKAGQIGISSRVGVSAGQTRRWRFFEVGNSAVSRGKPSGPRNP